jgi:hypothetical protein
MGTGVYSIFNLYVVATFQLKVGRLFCMIYLFLNISLKILVQGVVFIVEVGSGSLVTLAWCIFRLWMEETLSRYGG